MKVSGEWTLTQDHHYLVECADSGAYVRMRSIDNGAVVEEVRPGRAAPGNGRVFVQPGGTLALVTWDATGNFAVWEVPGGRMISEFRSPARPLSVLVNEGQWRLVSEVDKQVSVGRYRRDVAMVWDLRTGAVIEEIHGDDLHLRFTGFGSRTAEPGFAAEAFSPDGRLRAGSTSRNGQAAIWLHQADSGEELFRTDVTTAEPVRSAFSADGHYLLSNWSASDASCLDVWKI
jgi:WD40 repeat protein